MKYTSEKLRILCFGTLIVDIITSKIKRIPHAGECVIGETTLNLGGNSFSSSVNLKRLIQDDALVYCYGNVGNDEFGKMFTKSLINENVECIIEQSNSMRTSTNLIIQENDFDRRYIFNSGANDNATENAICECISRIKPNIIVFGEIPSLGLSNSSFKNILRKIGDLNDVIIILDLLVNESEDYSWMVGYWDKIDIVHCNLGEGIHVTKMPDSKSICKWFINSKVKLPIVSDGKNGLDFEYKNEFRHVDPYTAIEIDATGAGDAALAGIISKIIDTHSINEFKADLISNEEMFQIMQYGSACGSIAVESSGCIGNITRELVNKRIST